MADKYNYVFTEKECLEWFKNPGYNPRTKSKIQIGKTRYKELQKQCEKFKNKVNDVKIVDNKKGDEEIFEDTQKQTVDDKDVEIEDKYYPNHTTSDFREKLNKLAQFAIHREPDHKEVKNITDFEKQVINACPKDGFNKAFFQYFVSQYMSIRTPYRSLLLYYTVGTGKTCAAVSIAESLLVDYKSSDPTPIYVLLPPALKHNFLQTVHDVNIKDANQCTGNRYNLLAKGDKKLATVQKIVNQRYKLMTYGEFSKFISQSKQPVSNKTIIVDEAHNLRHPDNDLDTKEEKDLQKNTTNVYNTLYDVLQNGKNNRLILMSGTPMYNLPNEIIDIFNLLLINDSKPVLKYNEKKPVDLKMVAKVSSSYVSYINSNNPYVYATQIVPDEAVDGLIMTKLSDLQKSYYKKQLDVSTSSESNLLKHFGPTNIIFNSSQGNLLSVMKRISKPDQFTYEYIDKSKPILYPDENHLGKHSPKMLSICNYVKNAQGIIIIYSRLIQEGIVPMALALEHMGYSRFIDGENDVNLLSHPNISRTSKKRYAILTSSNGAYVNIDKNFDKIIETINSPSNIDGDQIKILLITKKASEGLSFLNVREIHILDPWYHFNRKDQIVGRGIRRCSHINLPLKQRNVSVYMHCGYLDDYKTGDVHVYEIAKSKKNDMDNINRIIQENAIDCSINKNLNLYSKELFKKINPIKYITSQGKDIEINIGNDDIHTCPETANELNEINLNENNMNVVERLVNILVKKMKNVNTLHYDEIKEILQISNQRYIDLAIKRCIYPNKLLPKHNIFWGNNSLYKVKKSNLNVQNEIVTDSIISDKIEDKKEDKDQKYWIGIKSIEDKYSNFDLLYYLYHQFTQDSFYPIMKHIITHPKEYPKCIKILSEQSLILENKYYVDIFAEDYSIKDVEDNYIQSDKYDKQSVEIDVKNKEFFGTISTNFTKSNNKYNVVFKIHEKQNKGAICISKQSKELNKIISSSTERPKKEICINIAKKLYTEGNLKIVPYKKMNKKKK